MRNKGFFWFLTVLLTVVCIYQVSLSFVANSVEKKAEKEAMAEIADLEKTAPSTGLVTVNNAVVNITTDEGKEIAKAAIVNRILQSKQDKSVYPLLGTSYGKVKTGSLSFGLDLVGGMAVTMEINTPEFVKGLALNQRDPKFTRVFDAAVADYNKGQDFIDAFDNAFNKFNNGQKMARLFNLVDLEGLNNNSSNSDVIAFLRDRLNSSMDGVEEIMNRRVNQFGVSQPNIQKDPANNRLYIELPGVLDEATVAKQLQSTANLQFFELYAAQELQAFWNEATMLSTQDEGDTTAAAGDTTLTQALSDISTNKEGLGTLVQPVGGGMIGAVKPSDKGKVQAMLAREDIAAIFPEDVRFMWSAETFEFGTKKEPMYTLYACKMPSTGKAMVEGKHIANARTGVTQDGKISVNLDFTSEGTDLWSQMTTENVGRQVAITMDGIVYSAPNVNEPITSGGTEISGSFTAEDATQLAGLLNGGSLPAPCVIKEQTKVGPTIGAENASAGLISFAIALLIVFLYMIFYYGKGGIVADIALLGNIIFIFGALASFKAVLTLAGLAGIVLTIGMAVDANVLIFERIREEEAAGVDQKSAVSNGFKKALSSIIDANVTTLLTAIVLKIFGSGPIESFATTLIIGIFTSVFAALIISRLVIEWMLKKNMVIGFSTKMTQGMFKNVNIDWVGKRKIYYGISGLLILGGLVALLTRGLNPSVEFSGGRTYSVKFEKSAEGQLDYLDAKLKEVFTSNGKTASVQTKTKGSSYIVEITTNYKLAKADANDEVMNTLKQGLANASEKLGEGNVIESRSVSASISEELKTSSSIAIILSLIIIFAYILMRFGKWQYSTGAIIAMVHDVVLVLAAFAIFHGILPFNMDVDQAFIAAILTVIGYSINDTVIVFDRIRENLSFGSKGDQKAEINQALNDTLSRTFNTSMTTFVVLLIIFIFGGAAIQGFIFALMVGVGVGTYSSLCIATPVLIDLSKKIKA